MATRKKTASKNTRPTKRIKGRRAAGNDAWNSTDSNWKWNRSTKALAIALVVSTILVLVVIHEVKVVADQMRFHWAEQRISYAQSHLDEAMGVKVSTNWNNNCTGITENIGDSSVVCTVELQGTYTVTSEAEASSARTGFNKLIDSQRVFGSVIDNTSITAVNVPSKGLFCESNPDIMNEPISDGIKTKIDLEIKCSAPSSTNLYS